MDEVELIRMVMDILDEYLKKFHGEQEIKLTAMVTMLNQRIPLAMPPAVLTAFGRWTLAMCRSKGRDMVSSYLEWHSGTIDPT